MEVVAVGEPYESLTSLLVTVASVNVLLYLELLTTGQLRKGRFIF